MLIGIHLILSTQRPDANVLTGQIKSNFGYRICGKADDVLSNIILDSSIASDLITDKDKGLFVTQNKKVFKGYWFDDNIVFSESKGGRK